MNSSAAPEPEWRSTAAAGALERRALMLRTVRDFFAAREVLEVETPALMHRAATDPHVQSLAVDDGRQQYWLRTSPEYHMKRLLADHGKDIYQLGKVFRAGESGRLHHPEFTMLEWYRQGFTLTELATEACELIAELSLAGTRSIKGCRTMTYRDVFLQYCELDPLRASLEQLRAAASTQLPAEVFRDLEQALEHDRDDWLDVLAGQIIYPQLGQDELLVVTHYPASQAMLARLSPNDPTVAERFEIFYAGTELGNGFVELRDATEQAERFANDNRRRRQAGSAEHTPDELLLAALEAGLPECAGVALGFDRIVMLACELESIAAATSFAPAR